jgi:hypothetical protein
VKLIERFLHCDVHIHCRHRETLNEDATTCIVEINSVTAIKIRIIVELAMMKCSGEIV